jgi:hypothetical protein
VFDTESGCILPSTIPVSGFERSKDVMSLEEWTLWATVATAIQALRRGLCSARLEKRSS